MGREAINNAFYDDLKTQWYLAENHPIALLRAEHPIKLSWIQQHLDRISFQKLEILDIGCGAGFLSNDLARLGNKVVGIDLSQESLTIARERDETKSVHYVQANAYQLPFEKESFDVVAAMDFLEHVEEPKKVIQEISRVLKPNGLFFYYTFNRTLLSWLFVLKGFEWFVKNAPRDMHVYSLFLKPKEVREMCITSCLNVIDIQGVMPDFRTKAFWKLLKNGTVDPRFSFKQTKSLACGYLGLAKKLEPWLT